MNWISAGFVATLTATAITAHARSWEAFDRHHQVSDAPQLESTSICLGNDCYHSNTGDIHDPTVNHIQLENSNVATQIPTTAQPFVDEEMGCTRVTNRAEMVAAVEAATAPGASGQLTLCPGEIIFYAHEDPIDLGKRSIHVNCGGEPGTCVFRKL